MTDMRLVVAGAAGRMGSTLVRTIASTPGMLLAGALERHGMPEIGADAGLIAGIGPLGIPVSDDPEELFARADGLIDFTSPAATVEFSKRAAQSRIVHVIGTTGLDAQDDKMIEAASRDAVIVRSANMSFGINLLVELVKQVSTLLDDNFDIEIIEMHHRNKVDSPSGTAMMLARAAAEGRHVDLDQTAHFGRGSDPAKHSARRVGEIGVATLRGGSVICDHKIIFAGPSERLELTHRADDRAIFAKGALKAALWGRNRTPGLYAMADVLGMPKH
jgi:4-hydroxy-tetrahydrodipicolinate reductase